MIDRARAVRLTVDVVPSVALAVAGGHELLYNHAPTWQWLVLSGFVVLLVARRRSPGPVLVATVVLALGLWTQDVLLVAELAVLVALHAVAWLRPRAWAVTAGVAVEIGAVLVAARFAPTGSVNDGVVLLSGLVLTAVLLGTTQRAQRTLLEALVERADQLERERSQKALMTAAEERTRIAREIHDIVAHSVSVMIALSEGAARTPDQEASRSTIRQVAATGREALAELRRVLSVLHSPGPDGRTPQPLLAGLPALLHDVELAGLPVDLTVSGDAGPVPEALQATVYRIVQESLTNTLKHADRATCSQVHIAIDDTSVTVDVRDDGRPAPISATSGGNGIRGMSERARLYAGRVTAGPAVDGWRVHGELAREVGLT